MGAPAPETSFQKNLNYCFFQGSSHTSQTVAKTQARVTCSVRPAPPPASVMGLGDPEETRGLEDCRTLAQSQNFSVDAPAPAQLFPAAAVPPACRPVSCPRPSACRGRASPHDLS